MGGWRWLARRERVQESLRVERSEAYKEGRRQRGQAGGAQKTGGRVTMHGCCVVRVRRKMGRQCSKEDGGQEDVNGGTIHMKSAKSRE